jgi:hypothetical protein
MKRKHIPLVTLLVAAGCLALPAGGLCDRTNYLSVCQELVSTARGYEARANYHAQVSKNLMMQIENYAKLPKNQGTQQALDSLFSQYEENRAMEGKLRALYREATREADRCMRSAE